MLCHTQAGQSLVYQHFNSIYTPTGAVDMCGCVHQFGILVLRFSCDFAGAINPYRTARWKSALITSSVKLVTTIILFLIFDQIFKYDVVRFMGSGLRNIHGDSDMTTAILVHILCGLIAYSLICAACAMTLHFWSMMLPLLGITPLSMLMALYLCDGERFGLGTIGYGVWNGYSMCTHTDIISENTAALVLACLLWLTQVIYAFLFVAPVTIIPLSREETMFHSPGYNPMFLDQFILVNWRVDHLTPPKHRRRLIGQDQPARAAGNTLRRRKVYICSTMYREADFEQENLLKSIRHVHDAVRSHQAEGDNLQFESHIFFDGAVREKTYNEFVLQLFSLVETTLGFDVSKVDMYETPYGMQANWNMRPSRQGDEEEEDASLDAIDGLRFTVHLKDGHKYKNKKRWSQVMYMSYVLDYCCGQNGGNLDDTFILTTDADIVFSYSSVKALLDLMTRDDGVGAVCARTHPAGSGPLVWYQVFDYAIGHWFQKTAEHVIGSVMCCPGCFSVFRCKALKTVLHVYATKVEQATEFLTKDMGEDRWLCTLLVERGWQLVYCAASENHTFCPESFEEFYKQRRRWVPSTLANLSLCVQHSKKIIQNNDAVGWWFILYQALMIFSTIIAPGTIILLISSGLVYAYDWNQTATLIVISIVTVAFGYICVFHKKYEMLVAQILTFIFAVLMIAVFIGVIRQIVIDVNAEDCVGGVCVWAGNNTYIPTTGPSDCEPGYEWVVNCTTTRFLGAPIGVTSIYLAALSSMFIIAGLTHPSEFFCLGHGIWYLLCLPSGYIFLFVYSLCNMDSQSWGTREAKTANTGAADSKTKTWQEFIQSKLKWLRETFGTPGYGPYIPQVAMHPPNGYMLVPQNAPHPAGGVSPPVQQAADDDAEKLRTAGTSQQQQPEESQSEATAALEAEAETALHPTPESQPSTVPLRLPVQRAMSRPFTGGRKPVLLSEPSTVFFDDDLDMGSMDTDPRSRASTGASELEQQEELGFEAAEKKKWPCRTIHRVDIRTFLRGHQLEHLTERFQEEGYDDTMFLIGLTKDEMEKLGVDLSVRRSHLNREIKTLPPVSFEHGVPETIDSWLQSIGLPQYSENFRSKGYIAETRDDSIEGLKELTMEKLKGEIGIQKKGHLKHLVKALKFVRYPTERELKIRAVHKKISGRADPKLEKVEDKKKEQVFWEALREACMKPEMAVLGTNLDLADKLVELRNTSIMAVLIANILWIVIIQTLASHPELNVAGTNPIGLIFLLVYGIVYVTQFLSMLVHRLITVMHMLAAAQQDLQRRPEGIEDLEIPSTHEYDPEQSVQDHSDTDGYQSGASYQGFDSDADHQRLHSAPFSYQGDNDASERMPLTGGGGSGSGNRHRRHV
uniref:chitin synthase n=1 Tax=Leucosolenia complicata TaxID=433461 RepID=A0A023PNK4_9METZ|nr:chitin synthase [Leucosolenia complicata]